MNQLDANQLNALQELVDAIKSGKNFDAEHIMVGRNPVLLQTFFSNLLESLSGQLPNELKAMYVNAASHKFGKTKGPRNENKPFDLWKLSNDPLAFQTALQKHLAELPPQFQLGELNRVQKKCKFNLLDPQGKQLSTKKMHYGFADLYKFLGYPFGPGIARNSMQGQNPFYHPIEYPIPNIYSNNVLSHIKRFSPTQKLIDAKEIFEEMNSQAGGNSWFVGPVDSKVLDESYKKKIERMAELLSDVANRVYSPVTLSHLVSGQERPMKTYQDLNFNRLLWELNQVHLIKPISSDMPTVSGYSMSSSVLDQTRPRTAKKRATKRVAKRK